MFEDKSKINYPYEFTETTTIPLKNPINKNFKNGSGTHKINKRIVMFLVMYKYFYTIHVLLKSADIQRFFIHR